MKLLCRQARSGGPPVHVDASARVTFIFRFNGRWVKEECSVDLLWHLARDRDDFTEYFEGLLGASMYGAVEAAGAFEKERKKTSRKARGTRRKGK